MKPITVPTGVLMTFVGGTLDAYTYVSHGVFATAQTGNVVLLIAGAFAGRDPWQYLLPIIAFTLAVLAVQPVKHLRAERTARTAAASVLALEAVFLAAVGFLPGSAPSELMTVPLSALAGLQLGLFRSIGDVSFASIATTGNLLRLAEAGYAALTKRRRPELRVFLICAAVVAGFAAGAALGAAATLALHERAIWITAGLQLVVLALYLAPNRSVGAPTR